VRAYWAIFQARFRALLQYRAAALAGFGTQLFFGFVRVMVFDAFYRSSTSVQPMTFPEVVTYVWLGQATLLLVLFRPDEEVRALIRSGSVAYELVRPLDLYTLWFCRTVAARTSPMLLRALPMFVVAGLFLGLQPPASWTCAALWILATVGALLLSAAIGALLTIILLWTVSGEGLAALGPGLVFILSGMIIPLPLWPDWVQPVLNFLPFRGLADVPFRVYMGHIPPGEAVYALLHQAAWIAVFVVAGRRLVARGTRRLVVQGG